MRLVVGLGNPGEEYVGARHNLGFEVLDRLAEGRAFEKRKYRSLIARREIDGVETALLKPLTYVNRSGRAVRAAVVGFKLEKDALLIVCDDFSLPLGRLRFRARGSSGGHNGLASIAEHLGTEEYGRLRVGIGGPGRMDPADYVLRRFKKAERETVEQMTQDAADAVRFWLKSDIHECMNRFNQ
jgi:PTH1 family peptidyl-tRNA hydrolase